MKPSDVRYYQRALDRGELFISSQKKRWTIRYEGNYMHAYTAIYYVYHPDEPLLSKGECIHHIDFDNLNDHPDNLIRMKIKAHEAVHFQLVLDKVSPIVLAQIKRVWLRECGHIKAKQIWRELVKVIGYKLIGHLIHIYAPVWGEELRYDKAA